MFQRPQLYHPINSHSLAAVYVENAAMVHLDDEAAQNRNCSSANHKVTTRVCATQVSYRTWPHCPREELEAR